MKHIELIQATYPVYCTTLESLRTKLKSTKSSKYMYDELLFGNVSKYGQLVDLKLADTFSKLMTDVGEDPNLVIDELRTIDQINETFFDADFYVSDSVYHNGNAPVELIYTRQHIRDNIPSGPEHFKVMLGDLEVNWYFLISLIEQKLVNKLTLSTCYVTYYHDGSKWAYKWPEGCNCANDTILIKTITKVVDYLNKLTKEV